MFSELLEINFSGNEIFLRNFNLPTNLAKQINFLKIFKMQRYFYAQIISKARKDASSRNFISTEMNQPRQQIIGELGLPLHALFSFYASLASKITQVRV